MSLAGERPPLITLTTDFGIQDSYVACMKGMILDIAPGCQIVDLCHHVLPQDIRHGAYTLWSAAHLFPPGTVHVVVVDPGVGSGRKAVAVRAGGHTYVGPDNGVLWPLVAKEDSFVAHQLTEHRWFRDDISFTFHGRDIFAPVAAHVANGVDLASLGPELAELKTLDLFQPKKGKNKVEGKIIWTDHFGNCPTDISPKELPSFDEYKRCTLEVGAHHWIGIDRTFSDVQSGEPVAYINSFGLLELAVRNTSAVETLGLARGDQVVVTW